MVMRLCQTCRLNARQFAQSRYQQSMHMSTSQPALANQSRPSVPGIATALNSVSRRIRGPSPALFNTILREAVYHANKHDLPSVSSVALQSASQSESLPLDIALTTLKEAEATGSALGEETLAILSEFASLHPHILPSLILEAISSSNHPTEMYEALAKQSFAASHPDQLIFIICEMLERDLQPSASLVHSAIRACCEWAVPRLAVELAEKIEANSRDGRRVDASCWVDILISSAENHFLAGVDAAFDRVSHTRIFTPDAGMIDRILEVAASWGRPDLASKALALLSSIDAPVQEKHLVALLESYVTAGQVPEALRVVASIRSTGLHPTLAAVESIVSVLSTPEIVDQAFYGLEDMHKAGEVVDAVALNALILASARIKDLRRVRATQASLSSFGLRPDIDTFNSVLEGCINAEHSTLGGTVLSEMSNAGVTPDRITYEKLIKLCLIPADYEQAFFYLEKMKSEELRPSAAAYRSILVKCLVSNDRRWELVRQEMNVLGYRMDAATKRMIDERSRYKQ